MNYLMSIYKNIFNLSYKANNGAFVFVTSLGANVLNNSGALISNIIGRMNNIKKVKLIRIILVNLLSLVDVKMIDGKTIKIIDKYIPKKAEVVWVKISGNVPAIAPKKQIIDK